MVFIKWSKVKMIDRRVEWCRGGRYQIDGHFEGAVRLI